ncbi:NAD-dependent epimerase/dehydratase family protein [Ligilactobacillus acidipiscis]|uniref:NAD-dependent epimerase/dehydratase family protein n=1 Tax=Ligilactobacillus acidipiscis TaxID=89059 RepID=UPI0023F7564D|nr:NAD-dependent epimerase/dehydratase family protein [Ligilactobacillus acidipiscis]WEV56572.1 NAD-dependent epimerase/dehydratase family protein [Ligilactobacillus acidipiscis]
MSSVLAEDFEEMLTKNFPFERFANKTFFVTGATGLVGSVFIKALLYLNQRCNLNVKIVALIRNLKKAEDIFESDAMNDNLSFIVCELGKEDISYAGKIDYIVHGAAVTASKQIVSDPVGTILLAVNGTTQILELARNSRARAMVYLSSMEVYGQPVHNKEKTTENDLGLVDLSNVRSCYPESKRMCECLCTAYASQYNLKVMSARLAQTFGAGILPSENRVFAQFAKSGLKKEDIILHTAGNSEGNYVYTTDVVWGILTLLLRGESGEAYNISNENSHITIANMAKLVAHNVFKDRVRVSFDIPEDVSKMGYAPDVKMWLNNSKAKKLGWNPSVGLVESYRRMIRWMQEERFI